MNDQQLAKKILQAVGDEKNVSVVESKQAHLHFDVKDTSKAAISALEKTERIKSVVVNDKQIHVYTEGPVEHLYSEINQLRGVSTEESAVDEEKESTLSKILGIVSGGFAPILGVLAGSGLLLALLTVFNMFGWLSKESSTYAILYAAGHAVFYFFPVFLGITLTKKLGANPYVGGTIGAALLEPNFTNLVASGAENVDFLGIPVVLMSYSSTVFPIFIAVSFYAVMDKYLKKVIYKEIQMFVNPLLALLVVVPLTVLVFGPIGTLVGNGIGAGIEFLSLKSGLLTGALLGAGWTFITIFGLHWAIIPIAIANLSLGGDPIVGMAAAAPFAQIGLALAVMLKAKDKELKTLAGSAIVPSALAGTTEIISYGLLLRYRRTMIYVAIAGAVGGAINGVFGAKMMVFSLPSLLSIPAFSPIGIYCVGILTAFVIGFILTYLFGYENKNHKSSARVPLDTNPSSVRKESIGSPLTGEVIPLNQFSDLLFATETLGKGIVIEPAIGEVVSPVGGIVSTLFPTEHAIGITSEGGAEVLIYIGVDTVNLKGQYFTSHVKQGDKVEKGDLLIQFDIEKIKAAGYGVTTPIVITNTSQYLAINLTTKSNIKAKDKLLTVVV